MKYTTIELTHNHGTETQADYRSNNGNEEPHRGFGHIAFHTDDVYAVCAELEKAAVAAQTDTMCVIKVHTQRKRENAQKQMCAKVVCV